MWLVGLAIIIILEIIFSKSSKEPEQDDSYFFGNGEKFTDKDIMFVEMLDEDDE